MARINDIKKYSYKWTFFCYKVYYLYFRTLGDPVLLRDWVMFGLPSDTVSQDNSVYCMKGIRYPLMIDP